MILYRGVLTVVSFDMANVKSMRSVLIELTNRE
jgi:hypothetical protein